ncbi:hypothetical protein [Brevibacterium oceani]|uniref:hypothetical protein n=1 Tax=Brevibacterium oceani TaxID=358099 RepID=UPI0015E7DA91|nr:hypothetical protein [Brevibacterium oceani]
MRTAGLMMNDVWADRVLREHGVDAFGYEDLDAEITVLVESAELKHRGKDENHRPYLHLSGELRTVTPPSGILYGISEVDYSPGQGERVDAYYEFDDEQLVALARKGYFTNAFVVPESITDIPWELPAKIDMLVLAPTGTEADNGAPVVFTRVHGTGGLEVDLESSGYDVTEYFADHTAGVHREEQAAVDERGLKARSDAINSLFSEDEFEVDSVGQRIPEGRVEAAAQPAADSVSTGLVRAREAIEAEAEQYRAELESQDGTPENLYRDRVAVHDEAEAVEERSTDPAPTRRDLDLDLSLGDDVADLPDAGPSFEERKRRAVERAADLDHGEDASAKSYGD